MECIKAIHPECDGVISKRARVTDENNSFKMTLVIERECADGSTRKELVFRCPDSTCEAMLTPVPGDKDVFINLSCCPKCLIHEDEPVLKPKCHFPYFVNCKDLNDYQFYKPYNESRSFFMPKRCKNHGDGEHTPLAARLARVHRLPGLDDADHATLAAVDKWGPDFDENLSDTTSVEKRIEGFKLICRNLSKKEDETRERVKQKRIASGAKTQGVGRGVNFFREREGNKVVSAVHELKSNAWGKLFFPSKVGVIGPRPLITCYICSGLVVLANMPANKALLYEPVCTAQNRDGELLIEDPWVAANVLPWALVVQCHAQSMLTKAETYASRDISKDPEKYGAKGEPASKKFKANSTEDDDDDDRDRDSASGLVLPD